MTDSGDMELLRAYVRNGSQAAFGEVVRRHINLVYSVAFRFVGNSHEAQDVTQAVFIILAQKADRLRDKTILQGWLYETTRFTAAKFLRTRVRRQFREQEAYMQSALNDPGPENIWRQLEPLLEEAMSQLGEQERTLIALRFYENKSGAEVASALGLEEWAAHKRVARAVEKLRAFFARRGVTVSAGVLVAALMTHSVQAAPSGLASSVAATAALKGIGVTSATSTLIKSTLKIMAWTKAKTTVAAAVVVLLAAGTTTVAVKEIKPRLFPDRSWEVQYFDSRVLDRAQPQVAILPAKYAKSGGYGSSDDRYMGIGQTADVIIQDAYGFWSKARTIKNAEMPTGKYDFISNLRRGAQDALKQKVKEKFGLVGRFEEREMDVLLLQVKTSRAPGLRPAAANPGGYGMRAGSDQFSIQNGEMASVASFAEDRLRIPVIDRTDLTGRFDIDVKWREPDPRQPDPEIFKGVLLEQLGLELVPARETIKVLIIEKAS